MARHGKTRRGQQRYRFPTWGCKFGAVAVVIILLAGCGGDSGHVHDDDFIVAFLSPLELAIHRPFGRPFRVLEVGVTPFIDPRLGPEPYVLEMSGIAFFDGVEIIFEAYDIVRQAFIDPLGERVIDVLIVCNCFVDYVILHTPFGDTTIFFD
jgi:hypothetical protein